MSKRFHALDAYTPRPYFYDTIKTAAKRLGVEPHVVQHLAEERKITCFSAPGRSGHTVPVLFVKREEVYNLMERMGKPRPASATPPAAGLMATHKDGHQQPRPVATVSADGKRVRLHLKAGVTDWKIAGAYTYSEAPA